MAETTPAKRPFRFEDAVVRRGRRSHLELRVARLPTDTWLSMPVVLLHGRTPGPTVWLSGAVHGDELNGIEIIRRVVSSIDPEQLTGTVIAVPVVNVFGLVNDSRYLPDRRDLNRSFPGSARGSLAARLAHIVMERIVDRCEVGIDLHTGSAHRDNLPQIRADLSDPHTRSLAEAFAAPVMIDAPTRDGSLRWAATERGKKVLLYEGGQPDRFDTSAIELGERGVRRVLSAMEMYAPTDGQSPRTVELRGSHWIRGRRSGIARLSVELGDRVSTGQEVAHIADASGAHEVHVRAKEAGIVIGLARHPLVHRGDAIAHIGVPI